MRPSPKKHHIMQAINQHALHRIFLVIRTDAQRVHKRTGIVTAAVLFCFFFMQYLSLPSYVYTDLGRDLVPGYYRLKLHYDFWGVALFLGGLLFTNYVLSDLRSRDRRAAFLTLPASNLEKVVARWALTAAVFPLLMTLIYWLGVQTNAWIVQKMLGWQLVNLSLFDGYLWQWTFAYMALQPIFLLGALHFRRLAAVKTVLSSILFFLFLWMMFSFAVYLLIPNALPGVSFWGWAVFDHLPTRSLYAAANAYLPDAQAPAFKLIHLLMLLSPVFLLISFHKFKEKEITR